MFVHVLPAAEFSIDIATANPPAAEVKVSLNVVVPEPVSIAVGLARYAAHTPIPQADSEELNTTTIFPVAPVGTEAIHNSIGDAN